MDFFVNRYPFFLTHFTLFLDMGFPMESMARQWQTIVAFIPGMSANVQANKSTSLLSRMTISSSSTSDREVPNLVTWKYHGPIQASYRSSKGVCISFSSYILRSTFAMSIPCSPGWRIVVMAIHTLLFLDYFGSIMWQLFDPCELP